MNSYLYHWVPFFTTYSYKQEWSRWVEQHTLDQAFGFLEGTLINGENIMWLI